MNPSSPFSIRPFPPGHELTANKSSTPLPTPLISLLPAHGHIYWESLFPYLPLTPQPTVPGTAMGTDLLGVTAGLLVEEPSPYLTFGQHLTAGHSHHSFPDIHCGSPSCLSQNSFSDFLVGSSCKCWCSQFCPRPPSPPACASWVSSSHLGSNAHICVSSPHLPLELNLKTQLLLEGAWGVSQAPHIHHGQNRTCYLSPQTCCISDVQRILLFKQSYEICSWFISLSQPPPHINQSISQTQSLVYSIFKLSLQLGHLSPSLPSHQHLSLRLVEPPPSLLHPSPLQFILHREAGEVPLRYKSIFHNALHWMPLPSAEIPNSLSIGPYCLIWPGP